jgi:hypothetical protein
MEKRFTPSVTIQDPNDDRETYLACEVVASLLETWCLTSGKEDLDDDNSEDSKLRKKNKHGRSSDEDDTPS